ncbi:hypothetical protein Bca52824_089130 [Brassica carinata]|uniref:DNA-directed RNA polymerase N-terminal domain-containing protein n=1 Tax=Brassica carinata TaxID=52824 RepID=A0A8X7PEJ7_BRACI|nr:hypothetical protein Bca52824_089130 [Brassica carinata]
MLPTLSFLPADKMAVIVMHKMMGLVMSGHEDGCIQVVQAAVSIGIAIEYEVPIPEKPVSEDPEEIQLWKWSITLLLAINILFLLDLLTEDNKFQVARKMKDEEGFYYPHNPDFRSRAYPMHPHLNHLSSDLRRGTLEFAEGRPLGIIPCCCCLRYIYYD